MAWELLWIGLAELVLQINSGSLKWQAKQKLQPSDIQGRKYFQTDPEIIAVTTQREATHLKKVQNLLRIKRVSTGTLSESGC